MTHVPSDPGAYEQHLALIRSGKLLNQEPPAGFLNRQDCRRLLDEALGHPPIGSREFRMLDWLADLDTSTVVALAAVIHRARREERRRAAEQIDHMAEQAWASAQAAEKEDAGGFRAGLRRARWDALIEARRALLDADVTGSEVR